MAWGRTHNRELSTGRKNGIAPENGIPQMLSWFAKVIRDMHLLHSSSTCSLRQPICLCSHAKITYIGQLLVPLFGMHLLLVFALEFYWVGSLHPCLFMFICYVILIAGINVRIYTTIKFSFTIDPQARQSEDKTYQLKEFS